MKPDEPSLQLATYASGAPAFMALLRGRLVEHNGCLVVGDEHGCDRGGRLVVFPEAQVSWDGHTLVYQGRRYHVGDVIEAGGGVMELERLEGLRLPEEWAATKRGFVVAPGS